MGPRQSKIVGKDWRAPLGRGTIQLLASSRGRGSASSGLAPRLPSIGQAALVPTGGRPGPSTAAGAAALRKFVAPNRTDLAPPWMGGAGGLWSPPFRQDDRPAIVPRVVQRRTREDPKKPMMGGAYASLNLDDLDIGAGQGAAKKARCGVAGRLAEEASSDFQHV